jgi:hypothetical protein
VVPPRLTGAGRIEVDLENLRLGKRALEPRRHDDLADLALVGHVLADQEFFTTCWVWSSRPAAAAAHARELSPKLKTFHAPLLGAKIGLEKGGEARHGPKILC